MPKDHLKAWDDQYRKHGRLWTGKPVDVPQLTKGSKVLELGCGDGKTLAALAKQEVALVGLDVSREGLLLAKKAMDRDGHEASLIHADVTSIPFADASFDAVVAFHILDHIYQEDREMAVEEIKRIVVPGGKVHFRGFSKEDLRASKGEQMLEEGTVLRGNGILNHYFTVHEVKELFFGLKPLELGIRVWKMGGNEALKRSFVLGDFIRV